MAAYPAGQHQRHRGRVQELLGEGEEVRLPLKGPQISGAAQGRRALHTAAGQFDQVDAEATEYGQDPRRVLGVEAAALEVGGVELDPDREAGAHLRADGRDDLGEQPHPVVQAAAPAVGAPVDQRGEELAEEVAVGGVDLHPVEAGLLGPPGRDREPGDGGLDVGLGHRGGAGEALGVLAEVHPYVGGRPGRAGHLGAHLTTRVVDLHPDPPAARGRGPGPAAEGVERGTGVEDDRARRGQCAAVDHHVPGDQQSGAALRPAVVEPLDALVGQLAGPGEALLHRGLRQPVRQDRPTRQLQWREQVHQHSPRKRVARVIPRPGAKIPLPPRPPAGSGGARIRPPGGAGTAACASAPHTRNAPGRPARGVRVRRWCGAGQRSATASPAWAAAAWTVCSSRTAMVIGPTPPGTGVIREARAAADSKWTSPTLPSL